VWHRHRRYPAKETLWWLNLLEIPPVVANQKNEGQNVLQLAIRSRFAGNTADGNVERRRVADGETTAAGGQGQLLGRRIALWWLNLLEIPPVVANQKNEGQNVLQLAIRSRFKFKIRLTVM
jgi:P pilus assembly chaperone PapD